MIARYDTPLVQITLSDGRTVYKTARPTAVQRSTADIIVSIGEQDRFDVLSNNLYGQASNWWIIASANGKVNGSLTVPIGTDVNIPPAQ